MANATDILPRHYQTSADEAIAKLMADGERGAFVLHATGTGKTVQIALAARHTTDKVLVIAQQRLLVKQLARELETLTGETVDIEMADQRAGGSCGDHARIIVASMQSLKQPRRLRRYYPFEFGLIACDEAHRFHRRSQNCRRVLEHFGMNHGAFLLGTTAWVDPRRKGGGWGDYFPHVAAQYHLRQGILDGYLVEPKQRYVAIEEIEWEQVLQGRNEYSTQAIAEVMDRTDNVHKAVWAALKELGDRPALWCCANVEHAEHVCDAINSPGYRSMRAGPAVAIHGGGPNKQFPVRVRPSTALRGFKRGDYHHIVACDMLVEGFDEPRIAGVVMLRPFRKIGPYYQRIGRSTRALKSIFLDPALTPEQRRALIAGSAKPDSLVIDICGASLEHKMRPIDMTDILCRAVGVREEVRGMAARKNTSIILSEAEMLTRLNTERALRDTVAARRVAYTVQDVALFGDDPKQQQGIQQSKDNRPQWFHKKMLQKAGISVHNMTKAEAAAAYARVRAVSRGKLSDGVLKVLLRAGYKDADINDWMPWKASLVIDLMKARGWKRPDYPLVRKVWQLKPTAGGYRAVIKEPSGICRVVGPEFANQDSCRNVIRLCIEDEHGKPIPLKTETIKDERTEETLFE